MALQLNNSGYSQETIALVEREFFEADDYKYIIWSSNKYVHTKTKMIPGNSQKH